MDAAAATAAAATAATTTGRRRSPFWSFFAVLPSTKTRPDARAMCCGAVLLSAQPDRDLIPHLVACPHVDDVTRARAQEAYDAKQKQSKQQKQQSRKRDATTNSTTDPGTTTGTTTTTTNHLPPTKIAKKRAADSDDRGVCSNLSLPVHGDRFQLSTVQVIPPDRHSEREVLQRVAMLSPCRSSPYVQDDTDLTDPLHQYAIAQATSHKAQHLQPPLVPPMAAAATGDDVFHALVARAVDAGALPFAVVEHPAFLDLIHTIRPDLRVPSRRELADLLCERGQTDRSERRTLFRA